MDFFGSKISVKNRYDITINNFKSTNVNTKNAPTLESGQSHYIEVVWRGIPNKGNPQLNV